MSAASRMDAAASVAAVVVDAAITTPTTASAMARTLTITVDTTIIAVATTMTAVVTTTGEVTTMGVAAMQLRPSLLLSRFQVSTDKDHRPLHQVGFHLSLRALRLGVEMEGHRYRPLLALGVRHRQVMRHKTHRYQITGLRTRSWGTTVAVIKDEEVEGAEEAEEADTMAEAVAVVGMAGSRGTEGITNTAGFSMMDGATDSP